jgi:glycosyltransferase involved in cell wall biosynthesis
MSSLVSILIPCFNAEKWIAETLESAIAQTCQNKEIIVVDDGSTDRSLAIAKKFESPILKIISQENLGAGATRNRALMEAQGEFIQYLDADDLLSSRKIEEQILLLQQNLPGKVAVCGAIHFFDGQIPDKGIFDDGLPFLVDSDDPLEWLLKLLGADGVGGMVHPGAWLIPRKVADKVGFWDEQPSPDDDGEYFARVVLASNGICRATNIMSYYRKHQTSNNLSKGNSEKLQWGALRSLDLKAHYILKETNSLRAKRTLAKHYMERAILAYPAYPAITEMALKKVGEMGGSNYIPTLGGQGTELIKKLFGWRFARAASVYYNRWKNVSKTRLKSL